MDFICCHPRLRREREGGERSWPRATAGCDAAHTLHFPFLRPRSLHTFAVSHFAARRGGGAAAAAYAVAASSGVGKRRACAAPPDEFATFRVGRSLGVTTVCCGDSATLAQFFLPPPPNRVASMRRFGNE